MPDRPFAWEKSYPPGVRWDIDIVPGTLDAYFDRAVATYRDQPAIDFRERKITFGELSAEVTRAATTFVAAGIVPGDAIALYLPNVPWHPIAFFGGLKAGGRIVHLSPLDAERTLRHKLADSGARTLVTIDVAPMLPTALKLLDDGVIDRLVIGEDRRWGDSTAEPLALPPRDDVIRLDGCAAALAAWTVTRPEDIALLQYTGGTTGEPKGAMLSHANLTAALQIYQEWYGRQRTVRPGGERVICVLPLFHIYALTTILLRQLFNGNEILLRSRFDVEATLRDIEVKRATSFAGVPTMWIALANHPGIETRDFSSLEVCSSGGAPLPVEVQARFERLTGRRLVGGWGMSETCPAGTLIPITSPTKPGTIGLPVPRRRTRRRRPRRSGPGAGAGRDRRTSHQGAQRHRRLLEPARRNRALVRRRPLPHRRRRLHGRGRLLLPGRPQEGPDHLRRLQRLPADDRAGDLRASKRSPKCW